MNTLNEQIFPGFQLEVQESLGTIQSHDLGDEFDAAIEEAFQ